jgi:hypothetical protein
MSLDTLKRVFIYVCLILLSFALLDRSAALVLNEIVKRSEFRFSKLYRGGMEADIVVLGNSRSVNAFFAPEMQTVLGKTVFHLGFNGMSMAITETIFDDYLESNQAPDLVIIEVTNMNVGYGQLKAQRLYSGLSPRLRQLLNREYPLIGSFCGISHLYRFNSELFMRCLYYSNHSDQSWINGGTMNPSLLEDLQITTQTQDNMFDRFSDGWPALLSIIGKCKEQNIELRLIVSPYLPQYSETLPMDSWVGDFRDALPDSSMLYDFHKALKDPAHFADILHINREGNIALLSEMVEAGVFTVNEDSP